MNTDTEELELLRNANRDNIWLKEHFGEIAKEHNNEFVAIKNGAILAYSPTLDGLLKELTRMKENAHALLIKYITTAVTILYY